MRAPVVAVVSLAALAAVAARPQDPQRDAPLLRTAQQLAAIGPEHLRLQRLVGTWDVTWTTTSKGAGQREDRGQMVGTTMLGGRHIALRFTMQLGGAPFEAMQLLGFDTLRQQYTSSWRDDLSTWAVDCVGPPRSDAPDQLALAGTLFDARDPTGRPFRLALDLRDTKQVVAELNDTLDGREHLVQTQRWTKR